MTRFVGFLRHNAIALAALFIALGGTSYAAVAIPRNSVGSSQLRKGAVTTSKVRAGAITPGKLASKSFGGRILYFAEIENDGVVAASDPKGVKTEGWNLSSGGGLVVFPHSIPRDCFPLVSAASAAAPASSQPPAVGAGINGTTGVVVGVNASTPVTLAIVCTR